MNAGRCWDEISTLAGMRFQQIYDKLIFCIRVAARPRTFVRLLAK